MPPPFVIDTVAGLHILRDDLIEGGTKRRALQIMLSDISAQNIAYAGTVMGHGALALALAAKDTGKIAHIFIGLDTPDHPALQKLRDADASLHLLPPQPNAALHEVAMTWKQQENNAAVFPPAFDMPEFSSALAKLLQEFDAVPYNEIWTTCVSGTLTRAVQSAFPDKIFNTVKVVKADCDVGHATIHQAPEKYHQPAKSPPPYPSCPYTDAKLWQFAQQHAAPGALIWNTAG